MWLSGGWDRLVGADVDRPGERIAQRRRLQYAAATCPDVTTAAATAAVTVVITAAAATVATAVAAAVVIVTVVATSSTATAAGGERVSMGTDPTADHRRTKKRFWGGRSVAFGRTIWKRLGKDHLGWRWMAILIEKRDASKNSNNPTVAEFSRLDRDWKDYFIFIELSI